MNSKFARSRNGLVVSLGSKSFEAGSRPRYCTALKLLTLRSGCAAHSQTTVNDTQKKNKSNNINLDNINLPRARANPSEDHGSSQREAGGRPALDANILNGPRRGS